MSVRRAGALGMLVSTLLVLGVMASSPPAWAAPPSNDGWASAQVVVPPQTVDGTLVDATLEAANDYSVCGSIDRSVWYRFTAPTHGSVVLLLDAAGEMDANVVLFKQVRSKLSAVDCRNTDDQGQLTMIDDGLDPGATYAVRVATQRGSTADTFGLRVLIPTPPPTPPGRHLPDTGVKNKVDRILNQADAYWAWMRAGRTMRMSLRTDLCTSLQVYAPGTKDFADQAPIKALGCGGFGMFTPRESGRYFLVVTAARDRLVHRYSLRIAPARADDMVPGILIHNHATIRASVNGALDSRDLYRFDVVRRSALTLKLSGTPSLRLVRDDGTNLGSGPLVTRHLARGRYYVAVTGSGDYALRLSLRTITRSRLLVDGRRVATIAPTARARLRLRVLPAVRGPALVTVERLDPLEGWQFLRTFAPTVIRGTALVRFRPPSIGRYRVYASYLGTRDSAPSNTRLAWLLVQRPLAG